MDGYTAAVYIVHWAQKDRIAKHEPKRRIGEIHFDQTTQNIGSFRLGVG